MVSQLLPLPESFVLQFLSECCHSIKPRRINLIINLCLTVKLTVPITAVVVNWNRAEMLRESLRIARAQIDSEGRPWPLAVIVVDNGSTDGSQSLVRSEFPAVLLLENTENRGFCAANNQGIRAAKDEFIALLNNDAAADPHWIQHLQTAFEVAPDIGMAASKIVTWDDPAGSTKQDI